MKKTKRTLLCIMGIFLVLSLAGCGSNSLDLPIEKGTLILTKDGILTRYIVEDFEESYYLISELEDMVREEIREFNDGYKVNLTTEDNLPINVESVGMLEGISSKAYIALIFNNAQVYSDYMEEDLFIGKVSEALSIGYQLDRQAAEKHGEHLVIIFNENLEVRTEKKVIYNSDNINLLDNGYVDGTTAEGLKFIITK